MKVLKEEDLVSIQLAFQNIINYIYEEKEKTFEIRKKLKSNFNLTDSTDSIEAFEESTYRLKTLIDISRIIEDELFKFDIELEEIKEKR